MAETYAAVEHERNQLIAERAVIRKEREADKARIAELEAERNELRVALENVQKVACGEDQVADDPTISDDDTGGMTPGQTPEVWEDRTEWIYRYVTEALAGHPARPSDAELLSALLPAGSMIELHHLDDDDDTFVVSRGDEELGAELFADFFFKAILQAGGSRYTAHSCVAQWWRAVAIAATQKEDDA